MGNTKKSLIFIFITLFISWTSLISLNTQVDINPDIITPSFLQDTSGWADSVLSTMSLDEKLGQFFMVCANPYPEEKRKKEIELAGMTDARARPTNGVEKPS